MSSSNAPTGPIDADLDSRNLLSSRLDELVRSGALAVGQGHQLTLDKDSLPIVTGVDTKTNVKQNSEQQRLDNIIQFLESPVAPQFVDWNCARNALCQLRDEGVSREGDADLMAWNMVMAAHNSTIYYLRLLESLLKELEAKKTDVYRLNRIQTLIQHFPERACHLVGISTPDGLGDNAWDDFLAEMVLEKSVEVYRCIHQAWSAILDGQRRSFLGLSTEPEYYLRRFLDLDVVKALNEWRDKDVFMMLERKAITAQ